MASFSANDDDCDACMPAYMRHKSLFSPTVLLSWSPLFLTFFLSFIFTVSKVFPLLANEALGQDGVGGDFSIGSLVTGLRRGSEPRPSPAAKMGAIAATVRRMSTIVVGVTVALTTVLGQLVLCEIIGLLDPTARASALRATMSLLLCLLLTAIPSLEIYSIISSAGWSYSSSQPTSRWPKIRFAWMLHAIAYSSFLVIFWYVGDVMLAQHDLKSSAPKIASTMSLRQYASFSALDAVMSHIGVIGITLMALLSGFASVSSPWHSLLARSRPVSEGTLARKKAGLDSARDMLATKRSRLRALEQKMSNASQSTSRPSFLEKAASSFRGNPDSTERANLQIEISGLESMQLGLSSSYSLLSRRYGQQQRSKTSAGRLIAVAERSFAIYCLYRIVTTLFSFIRRKIIGTVPVSGAAAISVFHAASKGVSRGGGGGSGSSSASESDNSDSIFDPIMAMLGLMAPSGLDAAMLSRQLTFLLSGLMLLASFSSVLQTFHLFARFAPWILRAVDKNLPLIVAQVCGTYMISVTLLLRGRLGGSGMETERLTGLGGGELGWVDGWFEACFIIGACMTAVGIWAGRQVSGAEEWDDEGGDLEAGKMS